MADLIQNFKATTINEALKNIASRKYLLPAIQRKFVWKSEQIEKLFDSILQGYPINTFMLWKITDGSIKKGHMFYDFLLHFFSQIIYIRIMSILQRMRRRKISMLLSMVSKD